MFKTSISDNIDKISFGSSKVLLRTQHTRSAPNICETVNTTVPMETEEQQDYGGKTYQETVTTSPKEMMRQQHSCESLMTGERSTAYYTLLFCLHSMSLAQLTFGMLNFLMLASTDFNEQPGKFDKVGACVRVRTRIDAEAKSKHMHSFSLLFFLIIPLFFFFHYFYSTGLSRPLSLWPPSTF